MIYNEPFYYNNLQLEKQEPGKFYVYSNSPVFVKTCTRMVEIQYILFSAKIYWRTKIQLFFLCFLQPANFISFSLCSLCRFTWMLVSSGLPLLDSCEQGQWMCTIYCTHKWLFLPARLVSRPFLIGKSDNIIKSYWHRHG